VWIITVAQLLWDGNLVTRQGVLGIHPIRSTVANILNNVCIISLLFYYILLYFTCAP
jgi:hypothetical protein